MAKKRNLATEASKINTSPFPVAAPLPKNGSGVYGKAFHEQLTKMNNNVQHIPLSELHGQKSMLKMTTMRKLATTYPDPKWMESSNSIQHAKYPVVVNYNKKKIIHDGLHRATLAHMLGHKKLTCHFVDMDDLIGPNNKMEKGGAGGPGSVDGTVDGSPLGPNG